LNKFSSLKPFANIEFNETIFQQCINQIECDYYYPLISINNFVNEFILESKTINTDTIVIGTVDMFNMKDGIEDEYETSSTYIEGILKQTINEYPSKKFIIFHENIIIPDIGKMYSNIKWIHWSFMTCEHNEYINLQPIINKNIASKKYGIMLSNQMRCHRIALVSYLYGLHLDNKINITAMQLAEKCNATEDLMDLIPWDLKKCDQFKQTIEIGYDLACNVYIDNDMSYNSTYINCCANFKILHNEYQHSFVEIILETSYTSYGILTEKYLHSVYACNFPILIASCGSVKYLRELGFDMFDDIVNHSYDNIESPCLRMETAIQQNIHLFDKNVINEWHTVKDRFLNNVSFAKDKMYKVFESRIFNEFKKAI